VAEVGAAVEHADRGALARVAGLPRLGELVRLGVEDAELLQLLEVRALERRRVGVGHVVGLLLLAPGPQLLGRRPPVEQRVGIAEWAGGALELDQVDPDDALDAGELLQLLDADAPEHERLAPLAGRRVAVEQRLDRRHVARGRDHDRHALGRPRLDLGLELVVELGLGRIGLGLHLGRVSSPALGRCRRRQGHEADGERNSAGESGNDKLLGPTAHAFLP
jgi:hypothetical protein